jgi:ATP-dependent DNA ligase
MEALLVNELPHGESWQYEPKWDGFRCLAFRDGENVELQSKSGQSLGRYFPETVEALQKLKASKFVIDGELVITLNGDPSFDALLQRIHPAASRVTKLAKETPSRLIVFDLLVNDQGKAIFDEPLAKRRKKLDAFAKKYFARNKTIELSPQTSDDAIASSWLADPSVRLDGVIAKRLDLPYRSGERDGMQKVKRMRTADCVIGGFRYASSGKIVGSLLLGLYDEEGLLHHVGFSSSFNEAEKKELTKLLTPLIQPPGFTGNRPGGPSRWSTKKTGRVATAENKTSGRGSLRPFYWRAFSSWYEVPALAAREEAETVWVRSTRKSTEEVVRAVDRRAFAISLDITIGIRSSKGGRRDGEKRRRDGRTL